MVEILNVRPNSEEEQSLIREALIVTSVQLFPPLTSNEEEPAILLALQADLQTLLNQGKRQVAGGSFVGFFSQHDLVKIAKHILQVWTQVQNNRFLRL